VAFQKGQSGNPGGRPKENAEIKALAQEYGPEAISKLVELMRGDDRRVAQAAAQALLDRGFGKPAQTITGDEGGPVEFVVSWLK
jgi:hypothetical protein